MRIALIIPAFFPAVRYGGPIRSTLGLTRALVRLGVELRVLTTNADGPSVLEVETGRAVEIEPGIVVRYARRSMREATSLEFLRLLPEYVQWSDVVHLTAAYNFSTIPTLAVARWAEKPLVWSPRGAFQRWDGTARRRLKHTWEIACSRIAPEDTIVHVTAEDEAAQTRQRMRRFRVETVPNGVDIPEAVHHSTRSARLRLLFLGRLHPIKGVENLLDACALVDTGLAVSLTVAGAGESRYSGELEARARTLGIADHVAFVGTVDDARKAELFAQNDVLILPSHSENFGMVVAEALAHELPVIAAKGTPWAVVEREQCGLWVDNHPERLARAIASISSMDRVAMGKRGRRYVQRELGWETVATRMLHVFESAARGRHEARLAET